MKVLKILVLFLFAQVGYSQVKIDVKTDELRSRKHLISKIGLITHLKTLGHYKIVEINEKYTVWITEVTLIPKGDSILCASLVTLGKPSLLGGMKPILQRRAVCFLNLRELATDTSSDIKISVASAKREFNSLPSMKKLFGSSVDAGTQALNIFAPGTPAITGNLIAGLSNNLAEAFTSDWSTPITDLEALIAVKFGYVEMNELATMLQAQGELIY